MFAIIFGSRARNNVIGQIQLVCRQCRRQAHHTIVRSNRSFTLYFVPVVPTGQTTTTRCNLCGFQCRVSNEQADSWLSQAATFNPPPMNQAGAIGMKTAQQWMDEGKTHFGAARYSEALAAYEQTNRLDPNFAGGYYHKGMALKMLMRYE